MPRTHFAFGAYFRFCNTDEPRKHIYNIMVLSYKELKKREVVNIADGRSFGKITDLKLEFPCATLKGIVVCERKRSGLFWFLCKDEIFIDETQIVRIGGDVILVNVKNCGTSASQVVEISAKNEKSQQSGDKKCPPCPKPPNPPFPPVCPPNYPVPPNCPPVPPLATEQNDGLFGENVKFDFDDY